MTTLVAAETRTPTGDAPPAGLVLSFDVTGAVNRGLEAGFGSSAFRLRSEDAETAGNPNNSPSLITIVNGSLALDVTP